MGKLFPLPDEYYPFKSIGGKTNAYFFRTLQGVEYTILFKPSPYLFGEDKPYASFLYEFSLLVQDADFAFYRPDHLMAPTVIAIFLDFYNRNDRNICFYICDSSDAKQHIRKRKFAMWFNEYNRDELFIKFDGELKDVEDVLYPVSVIMVNGNPYRDEIKLAFSNLISGYNDQK